MKNDEVMQKLVNYMTVNETFEGTAAELANKLEIDISGNVLSRRIKKFENELKQLNILYAKERTGTQRTLILVKTQ